MSRGGGGVSRGVGGRWWWCRVGVGVVMVCAEEVEVEVVDVEVEQVGVEAELAGVEVAVV